MNCFDIIREDLVCLDGYNYNLAVNLQPKNKIDFKISGVC